MNQTRFSPKPIELPPVVAAPVYASTFQEAAEASPFPSRWQKASPTVRALCEDIFSGLRQLRTLDLVRMPDGSPLSDAVILDRVANIIGGMIGNYSISKRPGELKVSPSGGVTISNAEQAA